MRFNLFFILGLGLVFLWSCQKKNQSDQSFVELNKIEIGDALGLLILSQAEDEESGKNFYKILESSNKEESSIVPVDFLDKDGKQLEAFRVKEMLLLNSDYLLLKIFWPKNYQITVFLAQISTGILKPLPLYPYNFNFKVQQDACNKFYITGESSELYLLEDLEHPKITVVFDVNTKLSQPLVMKAGDIWGIKHSRDSFLAQKKINSSTLLPLTCWLGYPQKPEIIFDYFDHQDNLYLVTQQKMNTDLTVYKSDCREPQIELLFTFPQTTTSLKFYPWNDDLYALGVDQNKNFLYSFRPNPELAQTQEIEKIYYHLLPYHQHIGGYFYHFNPDEGLWRLNLADQQEEKLTKNLQFTKLHAFSGNENGSFLITGLSTSHQIFLYLAMKYQDQKFIQLPFSSKNVVTRALLFER